MNKEYEIAIIDSNTLACIGLKTILCDIYSTINIRTFETYDDFISYHQENFIHYFVSLQIYVEHTSFFLRSAVKTIIIAGENQAILYPELRILNVYQPEKDLIKQILLLQQHGHNKHADDARIPHWKKQNVLTTRESEVLVLLVQGYINKEIADRLNIGLSTVITHRKNITEKLGIKSVSKLAIYAVMNGYIETDKI